MISDSFNLPPLLQQEAQRCAVKLGVSLEQFIISAVAEKVEILAEHHDNPVFTELTYRRGAGGLAVPILHGTGLRVQTLAIAAQKWGLSAEQIAAEYDLSETQVNAALAFYAAHKQEIDEAIASEVALESIHNV
ncbi:DUF433 domain-containing protein [Nostoc sphaeroides]|uniref:DUF433 domain-containing protein n=1 Tax=Nostoc sphaeroides CCNUC1 TaxID=2653204 RepID=A0A5P8VWK9_9NOSO|nr:DUF433 domain-containing protein [Nostoc sphaeroides]MCC5629233.1 DUF433 domain-containing protein [Nostoc sphaeroides CHAB 2801]QFS44731.1 hypothetical protein GXM_02206 [Nostoc sphaeroides CCNUC1]